MCGKPVSKGYICDECYQSVKESIDRMKAWRDYVKELRTNVAITSAN